MDPKIRLDRRGLLRGGALLALVAPVLRQLEAKAAPPAAPRRLILLFSPNGPMKAAGPASGSETSFTFHDWWKPLERHRSRGIFMSHMAATGAGTVTGGGHGLGGQSFSGFGANGYAQKGESIDQTIGKRLELERRAGAVRSVVWGNYSAGRAGGTGDAFAAGAGRNIAPEMDPSRAWAQLFSKFVGTPTSDVARSKALARANGVLSFVRRDCGALKDALGKEGFDLLEDHCNTVSTIQSNLAANLPGTCSRPVDPGARPWTSFEQADAQTAAFIDLMAASLACELTHVIAYQFGAQASRNQIGSKYGVPSSPRADSGDSGPAHHPWTHQRDSDEKTTAMRLFTHFYASQVASLVDKLITTTDTSGKPLIDSTLIVWISELGGNASNTDAHQTGSLPVVLLGGGQDFRTGRYLRGPSADTGSSGAAYQQAGRETAQVLVSAMQYMGLEDVQTVGATGVRGPLARLHG